MSAQTVGLEVADRVATVTLQRPPVNALDLPTRQRLLDLFDELGERDDVGCVILTGAGRNFCAGADIKERAGLADEPARQAKLNRLVGEMFFAVMDSPKPVIAAINGPAIGAGMVLALCCDVLLAAETATFAMPEIDVGIAGGVKFLARHLGPSKARRLLLTGERAPARELHRLGMIEECVAPEKLPATARALAATIAAKSPLVLRRLKESFAAVEEMSLRGAYRHEQRVAVETSRSADSREAKRAFLEKRKPVFTGR
jgi:enoyl-CoA hydratase